MLKKTSLIFIIKFISIALGYLLTLYLTNSLSSSDFGEVSLIISWAHLVGIFIVLGQDTNNLKLEGSLENQKAGEYLGKTLIILSINSALIYSLFIVAVYILNVETFGNYIFIIFGLTSLDSISRILSQILRGRAKVITAYSPDLLLRPILIMAFIFCLLRIDATNNKLNLSQYFTIHYLALALVCLFLFLYLLNLRKKHKKDFTKKDLSLSKLYLSGIPFFLVSAFSLLNSQIDILLVGEYMTMKEVAFYAVAAKLARILSIPIDAINFTIAPQFISRFNENKIKELKRLFILSRRTSILISFLLAASLYLLRFEMLQLFGEEYLAANQILIVLMASQFINACFGPQNTLLQMTGEEKFNSLASAIALVANLLISIPLLLKFGSIGVAFGTVASNLICNILIFSRTKKILN